MNAPDKQQTFFKFDNSYAKLPDRFYARLTPTPVRAPHLIKLNAILAEHLGLEPDYLKSPEGVDILAGNYLPRGADPIAMAYAGHQFGGWVPQLGDGRAILIGEVTGQDGKRRDIQLKGAGRTPFSRSGDGRAAVGPVLREYIISEAMAALGVPTTRALAAVTTGEQIMRETLLPGAILTRVALSHIRVGTFQFFAAREDTEALRLLADHVITRHYPDLAEADQPYHRLLEAVMDRQAMLVAKWMGIGFIHGVMNTDNTSIAGETIDYGPCAFMDTFHPGTVFSSIDHAGRYAYGNQPRIAQWNLARFAQCLLPLLDNNQDAAIDFAQAAIDDYPARYQTCWLKVMRTKLGLMTEMDGDLALIEDLFERMAANQADHTLTFRSLSSLSGSDATNDATVSSLFDDPAASESWIVTWRARLVAENSSDRDRQALMRSTNPRFIPRNHLVEAAIQAGLNGDYGPFEELVAVLAAPYDNKSGRDHFTKPPAPGEVVSATFCGT
ncbi:MAG: YdiU family protein [Pseudomonadota bacterium]